MKHERPGGPHHRAALGSAALMAISLASGTASLSGCYAPQIGLIRSGLDSLRVVVDTLVVRDAIAYRVLVDTRSQLAEQRDILLSTRATTGTTTQELFEQMERLQGRLDEVLTRFQQQRAPAQSSPGAGDPNQLYDQSAADLTQGRYGLALEGFRDFLRRFAANELSDNAQYGVGECFFAQSQFDSAAIEYRRVEEQFPKGDKVPASLFKLALSQEKLDQAAESKKTFQDLIRRFPNSGEAQLARDRTGGSKRR